MNRRIISLIVILFTLSFTNGQNREIENMDLGEINKLIVFKDGSMELIPNMMLDHTFFGYIKADTTSERLVLFSIFTGEVENNPYKCRLGAYYGTGWGKPVLKYLSTEGEFIKAKFVYKENNLESIVYFEKQWVEFE